MNKKIVILIFFLIILFMFYCLLNRENYSNIIDNISFNVITLSNEDRLNNIKEQENLSNIKINKFNAYRGIDLDQDQLIKSNILDVKFKFPSTKRSNEIGCYQSHLNLLKSLKNSQSKYHIILEDDFKFVPNINFFDTIDKVIAQTNFYSFDIIFLGWASNSSKSEQIYFSDNLCNFTSNNSFYGTYGYMVNSNSLDKIINLISWIDMPIDTKYNKLYSDNKLNMYWTIPIIIEPNYSLISTIL